MKWKSVWCSVASLHVASALIGPQPRAHSSTDGTLLIEQRSNWSLQTFAFEDVKAYDPAWTSTGPDSTDYNEETPCFLPFSVETTVAGIYLLLLSSAPIWLAVLTKRGETLTKAHMMESLALVAWLWSCVFLFTNILKFQSLHWTGTRPLTPAEAVYLLSQILTTVGYGDITPAFPRGQVWVGINVILALCLYGSIVMEVVEMAVSRLRSAMQSQEVIPDGATPLKDWNAVYKADIAPIAKSAAFFFTTATVGVLFWHFYPGEGKTWLQAIYMSIITLSTVGFGAFNATTEAGKVFGAFWMLIGVSSLGAFIGSFIQWMLLEKQAERHQASDDIDEFRRIVETCADKSGKLDKARFLKLGVMLSKGAPAEQLERIELRFQYLSSREGDVQCARRTKIVDSEGPPL